MDKIIILGAGQVGSSVAEQLYGENYDVTVVDQNPDILKDLQDRKDIRTVVGDGSSPEVLKLAGAEDAEYLIAVTQSDVVNMVACQVTETLFSPIEKLARVRSADYLAYSKELFSDEAFPIDSIISPEQVVTDEIRRLIEYPGALQIVDFAGGKVKLVAVRANQGRALVGHKLRELKDHLPTVNTRVVAIFRGKGTIIPTGSTIIEPNDIVFFISTRDDIREVMQELGKTDGGWDKIMLAGAGNIGLRLAMSLESSGHEVKLIERNQDRADLASEKLKSMVLRGDVADEELLREENIESMELFCALTNSDEANILSAMLAKKLGARRTMAIVNRTTYLDLIDRLEDMGLIGELPDIAISPRKSTISEVLIKVRKGKVVKEQPLRWGVAEAIEMEAQGSSSASGLVGRRLTEIKLPKGATIGAIMRDNELLPLDGDFVVREKDHIIVFVFDKKKIPEVVKLNQVRSGIFF